MVVNMERMSLRMKGTRILNAERSNSRKQDL